MIRDASEKSGIYWVEVFQKGDNFRGSSSRGAETLESNAESSGDVGKVQVDP